MSKTISQINRRIQEGRARVVRADEMSRIVRRLGPEEAAKEVDVVTTGTFGAMCSSGVWLNFGHSEPPIKMSRAWLNDVEAYAGVAAVDAYLGATQPSRSRGLAYGGGHVIEDLLSGREVVLRAVSYGTDCYPRKRILTRLTLSDLNSAVLSSPRNGYQRYNAAVNSSSRTLRTYMGTLKPRLGNVTYSGAGELSPLTNDPEYRTIGLGTRIFLGGGTGYVTGSGTQHNPDSRFGTLMVQGDLKKMSARYLRGASFPGYGCTLYVGLGIPIPVLDADLARRTGTADEAIQTEVVDYGVASRSRPALARVSYADLKSGWITVSGRRVPTSPLSSFFLAREIAESLKTWIRTGRFLLTAPVETLPRTASVKPLKLRPPRENAPQLRGPRPDGEGRGLLWDKARCVSCGHCLSLCPRGVFGRGRDWKIRVRPESCDGCGICARACPVQAVRAPRRPGHGKA
jgi:uncharacterized protein (DUF39 family)/NAD-dependent dihydropyrimidine dehydrogenase PreA subunit